MNFSKRGGFTLIELLTVIAIIAILAAMLFTGFSRVREMSRITTVDNAFLQIRNIAAAYYTQNTTYPPPVGGVFPKFKANYADIESGALTPQLDYSAYWQTFQTRPYMAALGIQGNDQFVDPFSLFSWNTDLKNTGISLLEYLPVGSKLNPTAPTIYPRDLPPLGPEGNAELSVLQGKNDEQRPYTYVAVNARHAIIAARYWTNNFDPYATSWNWNDGELRSISLPVVYDAFVLLSMGPGGDTGGLLEVNTSAPVATGAGTVAIQTAHQLPGYTPEAALGLQYYLAHLRTVFLATRDWNEDGIPDLSYQGRGDRGADYLMGGVSAQWNLLPPEALTRPGYGPYVFSYGLE